MIAWLMDWVRRRVGHWLLRDEDAEREAREAERERRMREIIDVGMSEDEAVDRLDDGSF